MYSVIKEYDKREKIREIRLDDDNYDVLEFKSLLKVKKSWAGI